MSDLAVIEAMVSGGPVAILAGIIFVMYIKDRHNSEKCLRADRVFMEDRLTKLLEQDQKTREDNTRAMTELTTLLMRMNSKG